MWIPLHAIQKIHETHDKIIGTRYCNLPEHFPIQKWDIKWPQPRRNRLGDSKPILKQANSRVWVPCTSKHGHQQQHEAYNSGINYTTPIKQMGWVLLHGVRYWETTTFLHMYRVTNQWTSNKKVRWPVHEGGKTINDQGATKFWMDLQNSNYRQRRKWTHTC